MRKVIKKEQVRVDDAQAPFPSEGGGSDHGLPGVRVIRAEGRITAIECTCRCGERTALEFEYGALEANAPQTGTQSKTKPASSDAAGLMQTEVE